MAWLDEVTSDVGGWDTLNMDPSFGESVFPAMNTPEEYINYYEQPSMGGWEGSLRQRMAPEFRDDQALADAEHYLLTKEQPWWALASPLYGAAKHVAQNYPLAGAGLRWAGDRTGFPLAGTGVSESTMDQVLWGLRGGRDWLVDVLSGFTQPPAPPIDLGAF